MVKEFWQGLSKEGTAHYLVQNKLTPALSANHLSYAIGDEDFINKTHTKVYLIEKLIQWVLKDVTLTCQDCGTHNSNVRIVSDFQAAGTLCPKCYQARINKW